MLSPRRDLLKELAETRALAGRIPEAVEDLSRNPVAQAITGGNATSIDLKPLWQLVRKLPPGRPVPPTPMLHVLTPDAPTFSVDVDTPEAQAAAWFWQFTIYGMRAYRFYVAAPPGLELAGVEI